MWTLKLFLDKWLKKSYQRRNKKNIYVYLQWWKMRMLQLYLNNWSLLLWKLSKYIWIETLLYTQYCLTPYTYSCDTSKEKFIGETGEEKTKLRDTVRVYLQLVKQSKYQQLKVKEYLRVLGKDKFQIFSLSQIWFKK